MGIQVRVRRLETRMDDVERLIEAFGARARWSVLSKLDVLMELERLSDARIVPFLMNVLADRREPTEVRIHVLKRLRNGRLQPAHRQSIAEAILQVVSDHSSPDLRLQAALALAEFTDIDGVPAALGGLALDPDETIDVRYFAFASLQRAGPTTECVALLSQLSADEVLGRSARSVLSSWQRE
jgi:HEAT repeat protein